MIKTGLITLFSSLVLSLAASTAPLATKTILENLSFYGDTVSINDHDSSLNLIDSRYKNAMARLQQQAASIRQYVKANNFNSEHCFLVDMSLPSGKNRFFVYNLKKDSVEFATLVAHGWGSGNPNNDQLVFSNTPNSFKTSLGKYKIGYSYHGTFGLAYKLYGLDNSNSNAFKRAIVLHSEINVPASEIYPSRIAVSAGCPMVSPSSLAILSNYINASKKPMLLWIYN